MRHRSKRAINCWIGQRIRQRRIALGITQQALGRALGVTWQQVQKYESGACSLRAARLYQLALFLRAPIDELFEGATADDAPIPLETGQSAPHANWPPSELECSEFLAAFRRIDRFALRSAFSHLARAVAVRGNGQTGH